MGVFLLSFPSYFLYDFLDVLLLSWDGSGRRAKGGLQRAACGLLEDGV